MMSLDFVGGGSKNVFVRYCNIFLLLINKRRCSCGLFVAVTVYLFSLEDGLGWVGFCIR
eukprot:jgi/Psemu1/305233/fgenesh1_kg.187_\